MVLLAPRNPYATTAALIRGLPTAMRGDRELNALTITQQAKLVGVGADTLSRLDTGSNPTQATLLSVLDYLARPAQIGA